MNRLALAALLLVSCTSADRERVSQARARIVRGSSMNEKRGRFACAELAGGKVIALASDVPGGIYSSTAEVFDPASFKWTLVTAKMNKGRWEHSAIRLTDGRVLVAGGYEDDASPAELSSVEIFNPGAGTFVVASSMANARKNFGLVRLSTGKVVAVAGEGVGGPELHAEVWDPATEKWAAWPTLSSAHAPSRAVALPDDSVLVTGGTDAPEVVSASGVKNTSSMKVPRSGATLTLLGDGTVLATGGEDAATTPLSSAEIYDPTTNAWTVTGSMTHARSEHAAVRVSNGLVIVAGGEKSGDIEAYDPKAKTFAVVGNLGTARSALCGTSQGDGAMFLGGALPDTFNTYVDLAQQWTPSPEGQPCIVGVECASGACASGSCTKPADAGTTTDAMPPSEAGGFEAGTSPTGVAPSSFQRCTKDSQCSTGHCVDGVCCDTACDQKCHSCALPSSPGKCTLEPVGVDLKGECGAALTCTGTCGPTGACIGSGPGAQCAKSRCTSASAGVGPAVCTASGAACPTDQALAFDCGAYACEPAFGTCLSSCGSTADCAGGYVCDTASKTCIAPSPAEDSGGCTYGDRASSGAAAFVLAGLAALTAMGRRSAVRGRR